MTHLSLVAHSMMSVALKGQKLVDRRHGGCVTRADPHLRATWPIDFLIADAAASSGHNRCPRHSFGVYLDGLGEVSGLDRGRDIPHVLLNPSDPKRVSTSATSEDD